MIAQSDPNGVVISHAEVIASNELSAIYGFEILDAANFLYDKLARGDQLVKKARAENVGYLVFDAARKLFIEIVHHIGHQGIGFGIVLDVKMPELLFFKLGDPSLQFEFMC
jgi:hypothetical protein